MSSTSNSLDVSFNGISVAATDKENSSAFAATQPDVWTRYYKGCVAALSDGLSDCPHASKASQLSVTHFIDDYLATPESWSLEKSVTRVLEALNRWLYHHGTGAGSYRATFAAFILQANTAHLFYIGNYRIWLFRNGALSQISLNETAPKTTSTTDEAPSLGESNQLLVEHLSIRIKKSDRLLLTNAGVHQNYTPAQMSDIVSDALSPDIVVTALTEKGKQHGKDATALLIDVNQLQMLNGSD